MVHNGASMGHGRYLRRRGYTWFFRLRWPASLAGCRFSGELVFSLKTGDYRCAERRARVVRLAMDTLMSRFTPSTTKAQAEAAVRQWIDACHWRREVNLAETNGIALFDPNEVEAMGREAASELDALLYFAAPIYIEEEKSRIARALRPSGEGMDGFTKVIGSAGQTLGVPVKQDVPDGRLWARTILRGYATLLDEMQETVAAIPRQFAGAAVTPAIPTFPFLKFWVDFENYKTDLREWKNDTRSNAASTAKLFEGFFPGASLADVFNGSLASDFKAKYLQLPNFYDKRRIWRDLSLAEIIDSTKDRRDLTRVTTNSSNKHISNLSEYCAFLIMKKHVPELKNPFDGLFTKRKKGKAARGDHAMWPVELDRQYFSSPIYFRCKSIHRRFEPGNEIHRDALFWIPLLGRTMGAREDELCSRKVSDIEFRDTEIGQVAYLKIRQSKTDSSARDVPFQEQVLDFGFLEFRYYGRDPEEPLFPELIEQGPGDRRSAAFTGRFAYARQKTGVLRPRVDFKSYRDTVQTELSNTEGINAGWIDELIGHDSIIRRSEGARYTKGVYMSILKKTLDKVRLPVDLWHLKYSGPRGVPAPGAAEEIARYVNLAQREMNKKTNRKRPPMQALP